MDTFLDFEKFYDSVDIVKLIQQACQLKWNPVVLYMSLLVHMAPRVLRIGDLWGEWISPCNSILQGCGSSKSWAGALLFFLLQDLHSRFPVQIGQQVDDINHHSQGTFFQALHWSVGNMHFRQRLEHSGADALPEQVSCRRFSPSSASGRHLLCATLASMRMRGKEGWSRSRTRGSRSVGETHRTV